MSVPVAHLTAPKFISNHLPSVHHQHPHYRVSSNLSLSFSLGITLEYCDFLPKTVTHCQSMLYFVFTQPMDLYNILLMNEVYTEQLLHQYLGERMQPTSHFTGIRALSVVLFSPSPSPITLPPSFLLLLGGGTKGWQSTGQECQRASQSFWPTDINKAEQKLLFRFQTDSDFTCSVEQKGNLKSLHF